MVHEEDLSGDGTVPRVSAVPLELGFDSATYFPNKHSALQSDDVAFGHMRGVLTEAEVDPRTFRASLGKSFSLYLEDAYDAGSPVTIEATATDHLQAIDGVIENVDTVTSMIVKLRPANGRYRVALPLASGAYRVRLFADSFHSVEDVFLVVDR